MLYLLCFVGGVIAGVVLMCIVSAAKEEDEK